MSEISFSSDQKAVLVKAIQAWFAEELDQEIGSFPAEFLMDFFTDKIGAYYYNQGLQDAQQIFSERIEHIGEAIYELEQPLELER